MAAGLGFKDFTTGEVLTAADVDGYLMQGVWVFADAAARDAAVTSPEEGNFAYLKDTNVTTYYTGSTWANLDTTGMTNPMTTTGDTIYSSSGSTPARLGIGTTGQVLTVAGGIPSWATPAGGGGKVLQVVQATTATNVVVASTVMADTGLSASITPSAATSKVLVLVSQQTQVYRTAPTAISGMRIMRDATEIFNAGNNGNGGLILSVTGGTTQYITTYIPLNYLDSPNTTSSVTYKTQACVSTTANGNQVSLNDGRDSSIILLEIGA